MRSSRKCCMHRNIGELQCHKEAQEEKPVREARSEKESILSSLKDFKCFNILIFTTLLNFLFIYPLFSKFSLSFIVVTLFSASFAYSGATGKPVQIFVIFNHGIIQCYDHFLLNSKLRHVNTLYFSILAFRQLSNNGEIYKIKQPVLYKFISFNVKCSFNSA